MYSGFYGVQLHRKETKQKALTTYTSASWNKTIAEQFMKGKGMLIQIDKKFKTNPNVHCCDVSWTSKFPWECEILLSRAVGWSSEFNCSIVDETNGVQTVLLQASHNGKLY